MRGDFLDFSCIEFAVYSGKACQGPSTSQTAISRMKAKEEGGEDIEKAMTTN